MHAIASSLALSSSSRAGSEFKSTIDGSCLEFERTATGDLCLLGQGKFGKVRCSTSAIEYSGHTVCASIFRV